jgi:hypothetical protein
MRRYSVQDLRSPKTYAADPELTRFARRVASARWTPKVGKGLAEWTDEHLVGRHAAMVACAIEAYLGYLNNRGSSPDPERHNEESVGTGASNGSRAHATSPASGSNSAKNARITGGE